MATVREATQGQHVSPPFTHSRTPLLSGIVQSEVILTLAGG